MAFVSSQALAVELVEDSDFERQHVGNGKVANTSNTWALKTGLLSGVYNPTESQYINESAQNNVAYVNAKGKIAQTLQAPLLMGKTYTVTMDVGWSNTDNFISYEARLLVDKAVIPITMTGDLEEGRFVQVTGSLTTDASHQEAIDSKEKIILELYNPNPEESVVHFDNISVEVTDTIPKPNTDTDGDGMTDNWETQYGFDPFNANDANEDTDNDNATNLEEFNAQTNPLESSDFPDEYTYVNKGNTRIEGAMRLLPQTSEPFACNVDHSAAMYFDSTLQQTLICDGTSWNEFQGAQGEQGDTGEQGVPGEKGDTGEQGIQGIQGLKGDKGDKGDTGEQGIQGLKGDKGDKGDTGEQGVQGLKGDKGDKGDTGEQGIQGLKGDKGDKGDTGEQGIQGIQGLKGDKGDKGDTGEQGIQGIQGDKGDKGDKGDTGEQGPPGAGAWVDGNNRVSTNVSVGIGNTTPAAALDVAGNVIANDPTANNHLTTKSYVDTQIASATAKTCVPTQISSFPETSGDVSVSGSGYVTGLSYVEATNGSRSSLFRGATVTVDGLSGRVNPTITSTWVNAPGDQLLNGLAPMNSRFNTGFSFSADWSINGSQFSETMVVVYYCLEQ